MKSYITSILLIISLVISLGYARGKEEVPPYAKVKGKDSCFSKMEYDLLAKGYVLTDVYQRPGGSTRIYRKPNNHLDGGAKASIRHYTPCCNSRWGEIRMRRRGVNNNDT